jgi:hypothetical protein
MPAMQRRIALAAAQTAGAAAYCHYFVKKRYGRVTVQPQGASLRPACTAVARGKKGYGRSQYDQGARLPLRPVLRVDVLDALHVLGVDRVHQLIAAVGHSIQRDGGGGGGTCQQLQSAPGGRRRRANRQLVACSAARTKLVLERLQPQQVLWHNSRSAHLGLSQRCAMRIGRPATILTCCL